MAGKILSKDLGGLSKKEIKLLTECRDKEEAIEQFRIRGYELDVDELDVIKLAYERKDEVSDANSLSLEQLEQVAGGFRKEHEINYGRERKNDLLRFAETASSSDGDLGKKMNEKIAALGSENLPTSEQKAEIFVDSLMEETSTKVEVDSLAVEAVKDRYDKIINNGKTEKDFVLLDPRALNEAAILTELIIDKGIVKREEKENESDYFNRAAGYAIEIQALHYDRKENGHLRIDEVDDSKELKINCVLNVNFAPGNKAFNNVPVVVRKTSTDVGNGYALLENGNLITVGKVRDFNVLHKKMREEFLEILLENCNRYPEVEFDDDAEITEKLMLTHFTELKKIERGKEFVLRADMLENVTEITKIANDTAKAENDTAEAENDMAEAKNNITVMKSINVLANFATPKQWDLLKKKREEISEEEKKNLAQFINSHAADLVIDQTHEYMPEEPLKINDEVTDVVNDSNPLTTAKNTARGLGIATGAGAFITMAVATVSAALNGSIAILGNCFAVALPALFKGGIAAFVSCFASSTALGLGAAFLAGTAITGVLVIATAVAFTCWGIIKHTMGKGNINTDNMEAVMAASSSQPINSNSGRGDNDSSKEVVKTNQENVVNPEQPLVPSDDGADVNANPSIPQVTTDGTNNENPNP